MEWSRRPIVLFVLLALIILGAVAVLQVLDGLAAPLGPVATPITPLPSPVSRTGTATPSRAAPVLQATLSQATPLAVDQPFYLYMPEVYGLPLATPTPVPTLAPPTPTPTPTVPWPDALPVPGRSKLGLHVQWNNSPDIMEFVRRMKPAVIKAMDDLGFVAEVKAASPQTVIVARLTHLQPTEGDPEALARAFVAANLQTYLMHPAVDYWEGYNEPDVHGRMAWYARFEAERVRTMAQYGLRAAIGSFSTGVPEFEEYTAFLPAVRAAQQHGGILSLHEYDAPTFDRSVGLGLPGLPRYNNRGVLALRYRWWYEEVLKPAGLAIPLVITEAGVDGLVTNRPGPANARGWRDFGPYWAEHYGVHDPLAFYLGQLEWYDRQLQQDDYVIGWTLFTAGALGPQWQSYDVTEYLRHISTVIVAPQAR